MKTKIMRTIARNGIICAAFLSGWLSAGEPPSPLLWFSSPLPPESPVVGRWKVQFANGVVEACRISTNGTALVSEPERRSGGRAQVRRGATVIAYDDDRAERWTPIGARCVVEHWCPIPPGLKRMPGTVSNPSFDFSHPAPVLGIAGRVSETERFDWPDPTRDDTDVWIQWYFRFNGIPTNSLLQAGMRLREFTKVLGQPTQEYDMKDGRIITEDFKGQSEHWVEWLHNPQGFHVAPFIRVRVVDGVVKQLRAGR